MAKEFKHIDRLGRVIQVGDCVAVADHNSLVIATVTKLNPKMVQITKIAKHRYRSQNKYSFDMVKVEGPDVTMYLLKNT